MNKDIYFFCTCLLYLDWAGGALGSGLGAAAALSAGAVMAGGFCIFACGTEAFAMWLPGKSGTIVSPRGTHVE